MMWCTYVRTIQIQIQMYVCIVAMQHAHAACVYVGATCRSSKNDMRRLKIKGRSAFQCSFECCH